MGNIHAHDWTDERVEDLKRLWVRGHSAAEIAKRMRGITRNAVLGKIHRLGLAERHKPTAPLKAPPVKRAPAQNNAVTIKQLRPEPRPPAVVRMADWVEAPGTATILTLESHMCKWPIGDPADDKFTFCGRPKDGGPYCEGHARIAYQPQTAKAIKRDQRGLNRLAGRAA